MKDTFPGEQIMSTDIRAVPAFGKRFNEEAWAKGDQRRELAICPLRFSACVALLVGTAFLLLLEAIGLIVPGGVRLVGGPGAAIIWASGAPGVVTGLIVLVLAAYLAHTAVAIFRLAVDEQALVTLDRAGITVLSPGGEAEMAWEEVDRVGIVLSFVRLDRRPGAVRRLCTSRAYEQRRVRVPALLVSGGSQAFKQAVAEIRPDIAHRFFS